MINVQYFIKALKIKWLRRVIKNYESATWYDLSNIDFQKLFMLGPVYTRQLKQIIRNLFLESCASELDRLL